jgi:hypothetical protein
MDDISYSVFYLNINIYNKTIPYGVVIVGQISKSFRLEIIDTPESKDWQITLSDVKSYIEFQHRIENITHPLSIESDNVIWTEPIDDLFWSEFEKTLIDWALMTPEEWI